MLQEETLNEHVRSTEMISCIVLNKKEISPRIFQVEFMTSQPLNFSPGAYLVVSPEKKSGPKAYYSIASEPESTSHLICVKRSNNPVAYYLDSLKSGDRFFTGRPVAQYCMTTRAPRSACFIATGTGISPFRSILLSRCYWSEPPRQTCLIAGFMDEKEAIFINDLASLSKISIVLMLTRNPENALGLSGLPTYCGKVTDVLNERWNKSLELLWKETDFYLCGQPAMIEEARSLLGQRGVAQDSIFS